MSCSSRPPSRRPALHSNARSTQRGVVLFIALVTLVLFMLAGLATLRAVDSSTLMTGNLAFREATTQASDYGTETARQWLLNNQTSLTSDNANAGYSAYIDASFNPKSLALSAFYPLSSGAVQVVGGTIPAGYDVYYVIHRMCRVTGASTECLSAQGANVIGSNNSAPTYNNYSPTGTTSPYFLVTTKVVGPRNSVSYVQALIY